MRSECAERRAYTPAAVGAGDRYQAEVLGEAGRCHRLVSRRRELRHRVILVGANKCYDAHLPC